MCFHTNNNKTVEKWQFPSYALPKCEFPFNYFMLSTFPLPTKTNKTTRKRKRKLLLHILHYHFALKYLMFGEKENPRSFLISLS